MPQQRQLAAIMITDIVGYTALMGDDEAGAFEMLRINRELQRPVIERFGGKWIKELGDGILASFTTVSDAVYAAIEIQKNCSEKNEFALRIGIHQGEVVFEDNDIFGDAVNIASRIQTIANPGDIFFSESVYNNIHNKQDINATYVGQETLKHVREPVRIYAIHSSVQVPKTIANSAVSGTQIVQEQNRNSKKSRKTLYSIVLSFLVIAVAGILIIRPYLRKQYARNKLIPAIQQNVNDNFVGNSEAFTMATEAEKIIPEDTLLQRLLPLVSSQVNLSTEPEGAEVYWKSYNTPDAPWIKAGETPLRNIRFPRNYLRLQLRKKDFQHVEFAGPSAFGRLEVEIKSLKLDSLGILPENMVRIPTAVCDMRIVGLEQHAGEKVDEFLIDRFEVTNRRFKTFIDSGGYKNKKYWTTPFFLNGKEIPWDTAMAHFVDHTGRPGPAGWEAGNFPEGLGDHPVTGVSWYEAAAYASFVHKSLPTVFHWNLISETTRTENIVPLSNFNGKSTTAAGSLPGYSKYGVYDVAGNAREWCYNESNLPGQRFILGGGWNDATYAFNDSYVQPAMDRSVSNGFRCMKMLSDSGNQKDLVRTLRFEFRDYAKEKPVDDKTFAIFLNQFTYDKTDLHPVIEEKLASEYWTAEKIKLDAGYNNERLTAYLFLPVNFKPPYQVVLIYPTSASIYNRTFNVALNIRRIDFLLKSGRAVVYPIFKSTYDRGDNLNSDLQNETVFYKDHVIMWRKDAGRVIDYLETRPEIQKDKIAFLGISWGGFMGGIIPAVEQRIKVVVLNVGGMEMNTTLPEVDQLNFLPRVKQPVLMLNGKHDTFFPIESSQKPMFRLLGTPEKDKKIIISEVGHIVPQTVFVKETLSWLDKYLGTVN